MKVPSFVGILTVALIASLASGKPIEQSTTVNPTFTETITVGVSSTNPVGPPVPETDIFTPTLPPTLFWPGDAVESLGATNVTTACNATLVGCEEAAAQICYGNQYNLTEFIEQCISLIHTCPTIIPDTLAIETRGEDIDCTWCDAYFDGCAYLRGLNTTDSSTFMSDLTTSQCRLNTCQSVMFEGFCGDFCGYAHQDCTCRSPACNQDQAVELGTYSPDGFSTIISALPQDWWRTWSREAGGSWTIVGTPSFTPPTLTQTSTIVSSGSTGLVTVTVVTTMTWPSPSPLATAASTTTTPVGQPVARQTTYLNPFSLTDAAESSLFSEEYGAFQSSVSASVASSISAVETGTASTPN